MNAASGPDQESAVARVALALGVGVALAAAAVLAHLGRIAASPSVSQLPALHWMGPAQLGRIKSLRLDPQGRPPRTTEALARAAVAGVPLANEPFYAIALTRFTYERRRDPAAIKALLREAIDRHPRSRRARLLMLQHAVDSGDIGEAVDQLAVLYRLGSKPAQALIVALARSITTPRQIDEAVTAFNRHPELYKPLLRSFRQVDKSPAVSLRVVTQLPKAALADPEVAEMAIDEMVRSQAFGQARALWLTRNGQPAAGLIHSPNFRDARSAPPFNWRLVSGPIGAADRAPGGGLSLSYYGRSSGTLADQLVTLKPGRYELQVRYRTEGGTPGAIGVAVRCAAADNRELASSALAGRVGASQVARLGFAVPAAGCNGQLITLDGLPLVERSAQDLFVQRIDVRQADKP